MTLILTPRPAPGSQAAAVAATRFAQGPVMIGRAGDCQLVLPDATSVISSRHCRIDRTASGWAVHDTSTNGTWLNGQRLAAPQHLRDGDVLRIGGYDIGVNVAAGAAAPEADPWRRGATASPVAAAAPPRTAAEAGNAAALLCTAAGIRRDQVAATDGVVLQAAGAMLRAAVTGVAAMTAARGRARAEIGLSADPVAGNPLQSGQPAEMLLARLLTAPGPGAEAMTGALADLDAHQRATLTAMQQALRATLDHFAPEPILRRAGGKPDAAWRLYAEAFAADDGFIETFARELTAAYARRTADRPGG